MWLTQDDVSNAWGSVKNFMGDAWHNGQKVMGTIDRFANVGMRLLGAGAQTGLLKGRALESGLNMARGYDSIRSKTERFGRDIDKTMNVFRNTVPELGL